MEKTVLFERERNSSMIFWLERADRDADYTGTGETPMEIRIVRLLARLVSCICIYIGTTAMWQRRLYGELYRGSPVV